MIVRFVLLEQHAYVLMMSYLPKYYCNGWSHDTQGCRLQSAHLKIRDNKRSHLSLPSAFVSPAAHFLSSVVSGAINAKNKVRYINRVGRKCMHACLFARMRGELPLLNLLE